MSRRKRANPVRVAAYIEEKPSLHHKPLVDEGDHGLHHHNDVENCKPGHGAPVFIGAPQLELLHHVARKNFTEPSRGSDVFKPSPVRPRNSANGIQNLIKRIPISKPITINKNSIAKSGPLLTQSQINQFAQLTQNGIQLKPTISFVTNNLNTQTVRLPPRKETTPLTQNPSPKPDLMVSVQPQQHLSEEDQLTELREKAVAIKTCMKLTMEEVEALIEAGLVVRVVSNRKKPDQSLKYECKFCIYFNHDTNGEVKMRSFGRKEEIKRHHMLHLRYERFQCQYCPYKVVRSDHLHRHMKNKHPEINHPGPQSNRRKQLQIGNGDFESSADMSSAQFPGLEYSSNHFANSSSFVEEDVDDDDFGSNLVPKTEPLNDDSRLTTEAIQSVLASGKETWSSLHSLSLLQMQNLLRKAETEANKSVEEDDDDDPQELVIDTSAPQEHDVKSELIEDDGPTVKRIKF